MGMPVMDDTATAVKRKTAQRYGWFWPKDHAGRRNLRVIRGDVERLPFPSGNFDLVYSFGVLHHLPHPEQGFRESGFSGIDVKPLRGWVGRGTKA